MEAFGIRAAYDDRCIRVYQAYDRHIAEPALKAGRFVPPFKMGRMTWIKPSFNWMMYRCGYASKPGQEMVLGVDITREGFEWALRHAVLSHFVKAIHGTEEAWQQRVADRPVRIQWDPERDWRIQPIPGVRSIQIGLSGEAVERYVNEWIVGIDDVTPVAQRIGLAVNSQEKPSPHPMDDERPYPVPADIDQGILG
jgi:hypothetical protein